MKFQECKIKDLGQVITGHTPPTSEREYYGDTCPFIKPTDMRVDGRYIGDTEEGLSQEGLKKFKSKLVPKDTPCVVTIGTIGKLCLTKEISLCNQAVNCIVVDKQKYDPLFVFYLMKITVSTVKHLSSGTASGRENVSKSAFESIKVKVPPLPTQRKIAAILSAYDDLIENNTRRIVILEQMAQAIYREWFVHFRFPGHEGIRLVESEVGPVPEGWEVKRFSETTEISPSIQVDKEIEKPFVEMADLSTNSMVFEYTQTRTGGSGSKFQNNDILFPRITPSVENGKRGFVQFLSEGEVGLGSTEFIVFRSKSLCPEYVYFLSCEPDFRDHAAKSMVGASGRQRVQNQCFDSYLIAQPPPHLLIQFSQIVAPMFKIIQTLSSKNTNLRRTRDLLLPRLISGEVEVSALEITVS